MDPDDLSQEFELAFDTSRAALARENLRRRFGLSGESGGQPAEAGAGGANGAAPASGAGTGPSLAGGAPNASGAPAGATQQNGAASQSAPQTTWGPGGPMELPASGTDVQGRPGTPGEVGKGLGLIGRGIKDLLGGASEAVPQTYAGLGDAINNTLQAVEEIDNAIETQFGLPNLDPTEGLRLPVPDEADTVTGGLIRSTASFLGGFIPAMKAVRGISAGSRALQSMEAGALADLVVWDPHEQRLSTWLNQVPALAPLVPDYLADNNPENETAWEGRLKNAVDGTVLGFAADSLFRVFRYYKTARAANAAARAAAESGASLPDQAARDAMRGAATADLVPPLPEGALANLGDPGGGYLIQAPRGETIAQAARMERETRELGLISQSLPQGMSARFTKEGISVIGPDRRRLAILPRPENMDAAFLESIGQRIDQSGIVGQALEAVRTRITRAQEAAAQAGLPAEVDPLEELMDAARRGVGREPAQDFMRFPTIRLLRQQGGVQPGSSLAQELNAKGITTRTHPGLFSRNGIGAADNLPTREHPEFRDDGTGYVDEEDILSAIDEELAGNPRLPADIQARQTEFEEASRNASAFRQELEGLGVDFESMDNAAIRQRLADVEAERARLAEMEETPAPTSEAEYQGLAPDENVARSDVWSPTEITEAKRLGVDPDVIAAHSGGPRIYINHARINASDDVKALIQQVADSDAEAINAHRRGTVSNAQTVEEARDEFTRIEDLIGRAPGPMSAAQAVAARKILTASGEQLLSLAKAAQTATATAADLFNFRRAMQVHYAIQSEVVAARTETARALQSWRIPAGSSKQRADAIAEMLAQRGTGAMGGDVQKLARAISTLANNPAGLNALVQRSAMGRARDMIFEAWINGLLSSPKTHMVNALSNSITALWQIPERYLAAGIDNAFYGGDIQAGEVAAQMYGLVQGVRDGARLVLRGAGDPRVADLFENFKSVERGQGAAITAVAAGADPNSWLGRGIDYAGMLIRGPGGALDISDRFFKSVNYRMQLNALALRQAASEGLEGDDLARRVGDILANPPETLKLEALDAAEVNTFTKQLGERGAGFQRLASQVPFGRVVFPFIRTPTNILKYTFSRTPLAYFSGRIRSDIRAGGARAAQAHARVAAGTMLMLTIGGLTGEGTITGNGPSDRTLRARKMETGWRPYSWKPPGFDRYFAYNRLDPLGMLMGFGADIGEIIGNLDEPEADKLAVAAATAFTQNLASKTWARGAFSLIGALDPSNPMGGIDRYLEETASGGVPFSGLLRHIANTMDPRMRDVEASAEAGETMQGLPAPVAEFLQEVINRYRDNIPGLGEGLPGKTNLWGEPITTETGFGWVYDFLSPVGGSAAKNDPVSQMVVDNRIKLSLPDRTIRGVRLTSEEYWTYVRLAGEPAKAELARIMQQPIFKRLSDGPDGAKADIVRNVIKVYRDLASAQMGLRSPRLRSAQFAAARDKLKLNQLGAPQ